MLSARPFTASHPRPGVNCRHWRPRCRSIITAASSKSCVQAVAAATSTGLPAAGASLLRLVGLNSSLGTFLAFAAAPFARGGLRRLFGRRRRNPKRRAPAGKGTMNNATAVFSVCTYNVRGIMDRWLERQPLLRQALHDIDADVLCFQECLTGEFGQERRLLPAWYHVFPCKAALFNLARSGGILRWYAHTVQQLLDIPPLCRVLTSLPVAVEGWRERLTLRSDFFRNLRDLAMAPFFGNSVACRIADAHEIKHSTLVLGDWRAAQRIQFYIGRGEEEQGVESGSTAEASAGSRHTSAPRWWQQLQQQNSVGGGSNLGERSVVSGDGGFKVWVVNTHLDHEHPDNRQKQALAVCAWMDKEKEDCAAILLCGDFNGNPSEPFHAALRNLGYQSAYAQQHGCEPQGTWPTGIKAPLMDEGEFECLDYVYVWAAPNFSVKVLSAEVHGLQPAEHDKTLFPSDHAAIKTTLQVCRKAPVPLATHTADGA